MITMVILFGSLLVALCASVPIAVALGGIGMLSVLALHPDLIRGAAFTMWNATASSTLIAIPLFVLMGNIVRRTDLSLRFYRAATLWLRWLPGGLLHAVIVGTAVFAAVTGSSLATATTIGSASIPDLRGMRYNTRLAAGTIAAGGTLGILLPPSIPLIVYASMVEVSVGKLFLAAMAPGILMAAIFMLYVTIRVLRNPSLAPRDEGPRPSTRELLLSVKDMLPVLFIIALVTGAVYAGWATPTEVGALSVVTALVIASCLSELTWRVIRESIVDTVRFTSMIMIVIVGAQIFSYALFSLRVTNDVVQAILSLNASPSMVLVIVIVLYLVLGMFIESLSMMMLTLGVIAPLMFRLGYDPVWFGVVLVLLQEIAMIHPPIGLNLFVLKGMMPEETLGSVAWGALPYVWLLLLGLILLAVFPNIALWLPRHMT